LAEIQSTGTGDHEQHALGAPEVQKALPAPETTRVQPNTGGLIRRLVVVLMLLLVVGLGYWKYRSNQQETAATAAKTMAVADRAVPVTVSPVAEKTMAIYLTALGTVTAYNTVTVKSRVDGQLLSVPVREGQQVKVGQVLAMIDPRPYQAAVAQAEGQLAKDTASANNSKAEAARYAALYNAGVVSKESEQVQQSNAGQSVGTLEADRAAIQAARVNLSYARITSPINGVVGLRQVDAGNIVHASDANGLLVVTQLQPISVIFTLPEDQLPAVMKTLRAGKKLVVEAFDRSETQHLASGTLLTVDNQIDTTTGTVKAKAVFDNTDNALFPNQFVNVRLILEQRANALVIPAAALQTGVNGSFVYTVRPGMPPQSADAGRGAGAKGGKSAKVGTAQPSAAGAEGDAQPKRDPYYVDISPVVVDLTEGSQIILKSGVSTGDLIVIDGQEKLRKYSKVTPQQGRSNTGGPTTKEIGANSGSAGTAQPGRPDQPMSDPQDPKVQGGKVHDGKMQGGRTVQGGGGRP